MNRRNCSVEELHISLQKELPKYSSFKIENISLTGEFNLTVPRHIKKLTFTNVEMDNSLNLLTEGITEIVCNDVIIAKNCRIECSHDSSITFKNVTADGLFIKTLDTGKLRQLVISNVSFKTLSSIFTKHIFFLKIESLTMAPGDLGNYFQVCNASIGEIQLKNIAETNIGFFDCIFLKEVKLADSIFFMRFRKCEFIEEVHLFSVLISVRLYFDECTFNKYFQFYSGQLTEISTQANIAIEGSKFKERAIFDHLKIEKFELSDSSFEGAASFTSMFSEVAIIKNVIFFKAAYFDNSNVNVANRDTFRIIKSELLKTNNQVDAWKYQAKELHEQYKLYSWQNDFKEKFVLWANYNSNGYGQDWTKALAVTIFGSFFCYIAYVFSLQCRPEELNDFFKNYLEFFVLTHKLDFMKDYRPSSISYLIDTLSRVFIGYCIVQTVQAFRKHSKGG